MNSGYIGSSRSVRSRDAIDNYEIPLSLFSKSLISDFIETSDFTEQEKNYLMKVSVAKWTYIAKQIGSASWHHTGKYFNKTEHYSLEDIANELIERKDTLNDEYKNYIKATSKEKVEYTYSIINVQVWGGTRKHPKLVGEEKHKGIVIGDWFYYKCYDKISKLKKNSNKVNWCVEYNSYSELVKKNKNYKNTKKEFTEILKMKNIK